MIIVHVTGFFIPQLGYQETYLARLHAEMGHEVHVVTSNLLYPKKEYGVLREFFPGRETTPGTYSDELPGVIVHRLRARFELSGRNFNERVAGCGISAWSDDLQLTQGRFHAVAWNAF
jgi:hypothetical protein